MKAPDLELHMASAVSRMPWKLRREVCVEASSLLSQESNQLADAIDNRLEEWRDVGGAL